MSSFINMVFGGNEEEEKKVEEKKEEVESSDDDLSKEFSFGEESDSDAEGSVKENGTDASDISIISNLSIQSIDLNDSSVLVKDDVKEDDVKKEIEVVSDRMAKFRELMDRDKQSFAMRLMGILNEGTEQSA